MSVSTITANTHTDHVRSKSKPKTVKQQAVSPQSHKHAVRNAQNTRPDDQNQPASFNTPQRPARPAVTPVTAPNASTQAPASAKKDLNHLVGRPLVPFYLSDGVENTELSCVDDEREWNKTEDGKQVKVRQFVDGYFVDSCSIGQPGAVDNRSSASPQNKVTPVTSGAPVTSNKKPPAAASGKPPLSYAMIAATPVKTIKKVASVAPVATPAADSAPRTQRYAAPAFNNSPSPLNVPMPKFLSASKPAMSPTAEAEERDPSDQVVTKTSSHISLADKLQQQPSTRQLQQAAVETSRPSSATHDSETSLPLSLMHLINAQSSTSMPPLPTLVTPDSFPLPPHHLAVMPSSGPSLMYPPPVASLTGDAPKLLFLRQSSAGGNDGVVTQVPLAHLSGVHVPPAGFQSMPNHYSGVTHTRPWSQTPTPHFAPSHSVGSAAPLHMHAIVHPAFHHPAAMSGHFGQHPQQPIMHPLPPPPVAFNPYATGPVPVHHMPSNQHLYQPELTAAVKHLSLMHQH